MINFIKKLKNNFLIIFILNFQFNYGIIFLNRYFVPELCQTPFLTYRRLYQSIGIQPFIITSNEANFKNISDIRCNYYNPMIGYYDVMPNSKLGVYEISGLLKLRNLNDSINISDQGCQNCFPSEWVAAGLQIPVRLFGNIEGSGIAWSFTYELTKNLLIGWNTGFCFASGILNLQPTEESKSYILREGFLYDILNSYRNETNKINTGGTYTSFTTFADQDLYLRLEYATDFCARMRRIKVAGTIGTIIPTTPEYNIYNPSSFAIGMDGHLGLYGMGQIDLLLKEDVTFGILGRAIIQNSKNKYLRIPLTEEPIMYGTIAYCNVNPGNTYMFSPYISVEGIRRGLGFKLAYTTWNHMQDSICLLSSNISRDLLINGLDFSKRISSWAQEYCTVAFFYDFMREEEEHDMEPFIGFAADIPINLFFSNQSAKSYGLSFILETLY